MRYKSGNESELPEPKPDPSTIATFAPSGSAPANSSRPSNLEKALYASLSTGAWSSVKTFDMDAMEVKLKLGRLKESI